jgi:hypothetical protein
MDKTGRIGVSPPVNPYSYGLFLPQATAFNAKLIATALGSTCRTLTNHRGKT